MHRLTTMNRMALALGLAAPALATAQLHMPAAKETEAGYTWALGAAVNNGPVYPGSARRSTGLRPAIGLEVGRFTLSAGGGGALLDFDLNARDSGLTARILQWEHFRLSLGLRLDGGRTAGDDPMLSGLPDVRRTLRGRLTGVYAFNDALSLRSTLNQDLLGHQGGNTLQTGLRYEFTLSPRTEIGVGAGFSMANGTYMRSYFGVPGSAAGVSTLLPAYRPGGGLFNTELGVDFKTAIASRWVLYGGLGYSQLRGDALRSPLTVKPNNYTVSLGLAYRCCR